MGSAGGAAAAEAEPTTLGGRLKKLSREYGWSAVGVYFLLSAADFPFCYLLVKYLGTERIGEFRIPLSLFLGGLQCPAFGHESMPQNTLKNLDSDRSILEDGLG